MAANLVPETRTRARRGVATALRILAVVALFSVRLSPPTHAAGRVAGAAALAPLSLVGEEGGRGRDVLPLVAVALAFVVVRGWRRDRAAGFYG